MSSGVKHELQRLTVAEIPHRRQAMLRQPVAHMPVAVQSEPCRLHSHAAAGTRAAARSRMSVVQRRRPPGIRCSADDQQAPDKTSVLFVCLGNICRSPTAEAVFKTVVERAGKASPQPARR